MSLANALSAVLATVVVALAAWQLLARHRHAEARDRPERLRRARVAWEVRGLVVAVTGPCAAGILFGYLTSDYALPLLLFVGAGFLAAGLISPADERVRR